MKKQIIGVSSKYSFGYWEHYVVKFNNAEDAQTWLNTEEYDFRERELFKSEWHASRAIGKGAKAMIQDAPVISYDEVIAYA